MSASITIIVDDNTHWRPLLQQTLAASPFQSYNLNWQNAASLGLIDVINTSIAIVTDDNEILSKIAEQINNGVTYSPLVVVLGWQFDEDVIDVIDFYLDFDSELSIRGFGAALQRSARHLNDVDSFSREIDSLSETIDQQTRLRREIEILKNAIVRNVSHELKTPLLQVKSAVSLMSEDSQDAELVSYAKNATGRLEALVKNITLLGSSLDTNRGPVIIRETIEYAKRNLRRTWEYREQIQRIVVEVEDNLAPVLADKQGISTVLQLLIDNALKFSKDEVIVSAVAEETEVHISVSDHGIGIPKDSQTAIFDSFVQLDSSTTRRYGGAGVGLAIVKIILDHHDTKIQLKSVVNEGTTFSFRLVKYDFL